MASRYGKSQPRPGQMTDTSIKEQLLNDLCLLIDSKIKGAFSKRRKDDREGEGEGEGERRNERRRNGSNKKVNGGFGARRRRKLKRAEAAKTPTPPSSLSSSSSPPSTLTPPPPPTPVPPPRTIPPENDDEIPNLERVDLTISRAVVATDSLSSQLAEYDKCLDEQLSMAEIRAELMEVDRELNLAKGKRVDQRLEFGRQNIMTGDNFWPSDTRYVPRTQSQDTVPSDTGHRIARNVPRTQDTVPSEVARNLHRTQGCQESARQKIPNITPPGRDMLNVELSKQPWFFGDIPFQIAWENMQEKAIIGNYLVLQNEELNYFIVWMSSHRTIKQQNIKAGALLKFINAEDFDTEYWEYSVQSFVQECENNINVCVKPLPNKAQLQKTSQNRYKQNLRKQVFCNYCQLFQSNIHLCPETMCWYNIDFNNLIFIRANTRAGAERRSHLLNNFGPRAQVFPTKSKMTMQLYEDAHEYWVKKERQEWLQNRREIFTRMSPEEWEQSIKKLDIGRCESDFRDLVNELKTKFWFAKQKKVFDKLNIQDLEKTIEDKYEQDCKAKELGDGIWLGGVARDTLKSLIAEMKTERQTKLAEANRTNEAPSDPGVKYCPTGLLVLL